MKKFPLEINSIYYDKPSPDMPYFQVKSTAIIGGICKNSTEILDKIVLANSFLDSFSQIILVGELGLAAIHALDLYAGCVERSEKNHSDYERVKEFMLKLIENAATKKCRLILPVDFVTAKKDTLENITAENANKNSARGEEMKS